MIYNYDAYENISKSKLRKKESLTSICSISNIHQYNITWLINKRNMLLQIK